MQLQAMPKSSRIGRFLDRFKAPPQIVQDNVDSEINYATVQYNSDLKKFESQNQKDISLMEKFNSWISFLSSAYSDYRDIELARLWEAEDNVEKMNHRIKYLPRYAAEIRLDLFDGEKRQMLQHIRDVHLSREAIDHLGIFVYDVFVLAKKNHEDVLKELRDSIIRTMTDKDLDRNDLEVKFYLYQGMRMLRYIEFRTYKNMINWQELSVSLPEIPIPPKFNLQNDLSNSERMELNSSSLSRYK